MHTHTGNYVTKQKNDGTDWGEFYVPKIITGIWSEGTDTRWKKRSITKSEVKKVVTGSRYD